MTSKKPWSCQELVDNAESWSLAGNVGLLMHFEQFAENLFHQANQTNNNLANLLKDLDSTDIQLDIVRNQFLGLQNTQFIESRVYEDDETVVSKPIDEVTEQKLDDCGKTELIKSAVTNGLEVLKKYYESVSIPESDSDADEPDYTSYMLRENDPYIHRPLPYIIGTDEWHTKWHAGLADSSDDDEDEGQNERKSTIEDEFSETDSESNLPVADRRYDAYIDAVHNNHIDNYAVDDVNYEEVNGNSLSAKTPIANATFADQLAAKLGGVLISSDPEVNNRPIQRRLTTSSSLLPEVPPPLPEQSNQKPEGGLFSGGDGLFDNYEDDVKPPPILSEKIQNQLKIPNLFDDDDDDDDNDDDDILVQSVSQKLPKTKCPRGLFDDTDSEDDSPLPVSSNSRLQVVPQDQPSTITTLKKPHAGGADALVGSLPIRRVSSSEEDVSVQSEAKPPPIVKTSESIPSAEKPTLTEKKVLSLFDDTDVLFEDDLFISSPKSSSKPMKGLFDDDEDADSLPRLKTELKSSRAHTNLFGDDLDLTKQQIYLFDDDAAISPGPPPLSSSSGDIISKNKKRNLFDESSDEEEVNIFRSLPVSENPAKKISNLFGEVERRSMIDDANVTDDVWPISIENPPVCPPNASIEEDLFGTEEEGANGDESILKKKSAILDNISDVNLNLSPKPPSLVHDVKKNNDVQEVKSPERKLPGKLKHNLNINVAALLPNVRKGKKSIPGEESERRDLQSNDVHPTNSTPIDQNDLEQSPSCPSDQIEVLCSVTKTRAKIPIRRKPSTRKGRKAALANSQSFNNSLEITPGESTIDSLDDSVKRKSEVEEDKEELLKIKEDKGNISQLDRNKPKYQDTFNDILPKLEDIFDTKTSPNSIFDDLEESLTENVGNEFFNQGHESSKTGTPRKQLIVDYDDEPEEFIAPPPLDNPLLQQESKTEIASMKKISLFDDLDIDCEHNDDFFNSAYLLRKEVANKDVGNVRVYEAPPSMDKRLILSSATVTETKKANKKVAPTSSTLFDDIPDDDALFADVPAKSTASQFITQNEDMLNYKTCEPPHTIKKDKSLFGDYDDTDDLFFTSFKPSKTLTPSRTLQVKNEKAGKMRSMFGDEDDDDDIFNTKSTKPSHTAMGTAQIGVKALPSKSKISSALSTKPKSDPLAALLGDGD